VQMLQMEDIDISETTIGDEVSIRVRREAKLLQQTLRRQFPAIPPLATRTNVTFFLGTVLYSNSVHTRSTTWEAFIDSLSPAAYIREHKEGLRESMVEVLIEDDL
jgi:hypothetical protein